MTAEEWKTGGLKMSIANFNAETLSLQKLDSAAAADDSYQNGYTVYITIGRTNYLKGNFGCQESYFFKNLREAENYCKNRWPGCSRKGVYVAQGDISAPRKIMVLKIPNNEEITLSIWRPLTAEELPAGAEFIKMRRKHIDYCYNKLPAGMDYEEQKSAANEAGFPLPDLPAELNSWN